jgi:hypothetical protein
LIRIFPKNGVFRLFLGQIKALFSVLPKNAHELSIFIFKGTFFFFHRQKDIKPLYERKKWRDSP